MKPSQRYLLAASLALALLPSAPAASALEAGVTTLVRREACWRFHDRGLDLGTDWKFSGTDDSAWSLGFAKLGYGQGDETTVVNFGPDAGNKYVTTYFRRDFTVPSPAAFTNLELRVKRDDGVVVYLNGDEVYRNNLTNGQNYVSLASLAANDGTNFIVSNLSPSLLLPDQNLLAVEIHQAAPSDPDLSFDLELVGQYGTNTPVLAAALVNASQVAVSWPWSASAGFVLQSSSQLGSTNWSAVTNPVVLVSGVRYATNTITPSSQFFRLAVAPEDLVPCQPPLVLAQPLGVSTAVGSNLVLSIETVGTPTIAYQWFHNTFPVVGATTPTLTLTNCHPEDGGRYELCMTSPCGNGFSEPITLTVGGTNVALADVFSARPTISSLTGQINSSNNLATAESGEPAHAGHAAERSMWLSYIAPQEGVLTMTTTGSAFDTLLAAYHGTNVAALEPIDADDDHGPAYTSAISFAVKANEHVEVAVDNYPRAAGVFQLSWSLAGAADVVPLILVQPQSQLAPLGGSFTLSVTATNPGSVVPLTYQWRKNGISLAGATASSLTVTGAQKTDTGLYEVVVSNGSFSKRSQLANVVLNLGSSPLPRAGGARPAGFGQLLDASTGQVITVNSDSKRAKCATYYYYGRYPDSGNLTLGQPFSVRTQSNSGTPTYSMIVNRPATSLWACSSTQSSVSYPPAGTYGYYFYILVPSIPVTFTASIGP